ncbi:PaaI family thioesterase [Alicyclobacillus mengziensis]|uniref:Acyl-coenzyme A thioesterase THEM4 n=1 Tax=Alicyclobacillus mengziensis TaxID=2931921 RepID=A0A9X7Z7W7_9BACL|nr:PaaI family thioesterase [Alicyclobacillus mengziensis]QSO48902.1 PaaI family thioesterase [Alicyclobacillus mengziensis]
MYRSQNCFGCGPENPMGLQLHIEQQDADGVITHFVSEKKHEGWPGIQHGGVTSALLDEVCGYVPNFMGLVAMTASLNVSFVAPIRVGESLKITAAPTRITRRLIDVQAKIVSKEGELKAEALAKMMVLSEEQRALAGLTELS